MELPYAVNYRLSIDSLGIVGVKLFVGDKELIEHREFINALPISEATNLFEGRVLCRFCSAKLVQTEIDVWDRACVVCVVQGKAD